jgi:predicted GNAT superfamily acetyltransferase
MSNSIFIRPAQREHLQEVQAINADSSPGVSALTSDALDQLFRTASVMWVASMDERVVGYLVGFAPGAVYDGEEFAWFRQLGHDFLYVDQIAAKASHRGMGIGAALYQELQTYAERNRLVSLTCEVNIEPPNPGSMAFHARLGFVEIGRLHTRDGRYVALLRKWLRTAATSK